MEDKNAGEKWENEKKNDEKAFFSLQNSRTMCIVHCMQIFAGVYRIIQLEVQDQDPGTIVAELLIKQKT